MRRSNKPKHARQRDEVRELVQAALDAGWRLKPGRKHDILLAPDGKTTCSISTRPEGRGYQNFRAELRRAGVEV